MCGRIASDLVDYCIFTFRKYNKEKELYLKKQNKNNSSNSLVFGRWLQTKMTDSMRTIIFSGQLVHGQNFLRRFSLRSNWRRLRIVRVKIVKFKGKVNWRWKYFFLSWSLRHPSGELSEIRQSFGLGASAEFHLWHLVVRFYLLHLSVHPCNQMFFGIKLISFGRILLYF